MFQSKVVHASCSIIVCIGQVSFAVEHRCFHASQIAASWAHSRVQIAVIAHSLPLVSRVSISGILLLAPLLNLNVVESPLLALVGALTFECLQGLAGLEPSLVFLLLLSLHLSEEVLLNLGSTSVSYTNHLTFFLSVVIVISIISRIWHFKHGNTSLGDGWIENILRTFLIEIAEIIAFLVLHLHLNLHCGGFLYYLDRFDDWSWDRWGHKSFHCVVFCWL